MKTALQLHDRNCYLVRDIQASCDVIDGKKPLSQHVRNKPIDDFDLAEFLKQFGPSGFSL